MHRSELLGVALLVPEPRGADDVVELGVARLPAEFAQALLRARDQDGGIAGAPGMDFRRNRMAGHAAGRFDDFAHAEAVTIPKLKMSRSCDWRASRARSARRPDRET